MRVLYLHERATVSGATLSLALSIEGLGSRVEPWVMAPPGRSAERLAEVARVVVAPSAGLMHIWSGVYSGSRWSLLPVQAAMLPRHLAALRRVLRSVRPDVVHVNDAPQLPSALFAQALGYPVVVHLRAALPEDGGALRSGLVQRVVRRADAAVAINADVAEAYGRPPNATIVPNPVHLPAPPATTSAAAKAALGLPADRPAIGFVGHLYRAKGWQQLLEAVAGIVSAGTEVSVALVGRPLRSPEWHRSARGRVLSALAGREDAAAELEGAIARLGLREHAHVVGWRDDMAEVYPALDVVCAPSQGPELSRPVLEAQAYGRPVVAVSRDGGGGIVEGEVTGMLVKRASPDLLAGALSRLLADADLQRRLGAAARAHAEREYAPEVVGARLARVYERARAVHAAR